MTDSPRRFFTTTITILAIAISVSGCAAAQKVGCPLARVLDGLCEATPDGG